VATTPDKPAVLKLDHSDKSLEYFRTRSLHISSPHPGSFGLYLSSHVAVGGSHLYFGLFFGVHALHSPCSQTGKKGDVGMLDCSVNFSHNASTHARADECILPQGGVNLCGVWACPTSENPARSTL